MMKQTTLSIIGISIALVLVILMVALPVSGAGKTGPQNGTGNQFGGQMCQNGGDQSGAQCGSGNGSCIREDCPNNASQPRDGTGMQYGRSGKGSGNGGHSGRGGQGCGHQFRT